jgi:hypothetical protein
MASFIPHTPYLLGGSNISYIPLPDDPTITGTQLLHDFILLDKTARFFYPTSSSEQGEIPAPIQNIFIQTSDPFSVDSTLRSSRACAIMWYSDRSPDFDPSGLGAIYEPYYTGTSSWTPSLIEVQPSGYDSFREQLQEVIHHYYQSVTIPTHNHPIVYNVSSTQSIVPIPPRSHPAELQSVVHASTSYAAVVSNSTNISNSLTTASNNLTTDVVYRHQDSEVQLLSNKFHDILSQFNTIQTVVELLETKYTSLSTQVVDVQSNMSTLSQGQATLQTAVVHLHTDITSQMTTIQTTMSNQLTSQFSNITSMLQGLVTPPPPPNPNHLPDGHGASQVDD